MTLGKLYNLSFVFLISKMEMIIRSITHHRVPEKFKRDNECRVLYQFPLASIINYYKFSNLAYNNTNLLLYSSGSQKSSTGITGPKSRYCLSYVPWEGSELLNSPSGC